MKEKIEGIVDRYIEENADEFNDFKLSKRTRYENLDNSEFAKVKNSETLQVLLHEVPEVLHNMLWNELSEEEWDFYISREGSRWFARKFPIFRVGDKV